MSLDESLGKFAGQRTFLIEYDANLRINANLRIANEECDANMQMIRIYKCTNARFEISKLVNSPACNASHSEAGR